VLQGDRLANGNSKVLPEAEASSASLGMTQHVTSPYKRRIMHQANAPGLQRRACCESLHPSKHC
jgi:hypothetical protein